MAINPHLMVNPFL